MAGSHDVPGTGRLLVASPTLRDPNFSHSVALLVEHGDNGTLGVILNRPGDVTVAATLPAWQSLAAEPGVVFLGGPVAPTGVLGLLLQVQEPDSLAEDVTVAATLPAWQSLAAEPGVVFLGGPVAPTGVLGLARSHSAEVTPVRPGVGLLDLQQDPDSLAEDVTAIRLFAGHAGWAAGQLDQEIAAGGWFVVDAAAQDAFSAEPGSLWRAVLRRRGGVFATVPEDPSLN